MKIKLNLTATYHDNGRPNMGTRITTEEIDHTDLFYRLRELSDSNLTHNDSPQGELVITFPKRDEVLVEIYNGLRE